MWTESYSLGTQSKKTHKDSCVMPLGINTSWIFFLIIFILFFIFLLPFLLSSPSFFHSVEKLEKSKHLKRTPGRSENGKLENVAEIKHFGSDIKHTRLADTLLRKPARLWELFTRGFWFHTAPLCSQVKQHVFFFHFMPSTACHYHPYCVHRLKQRRIVAHSL